MLETTKDDYSKYESKLNLQEAALKAYKHEVTVNANLDLGMHGVTRASLRVLCKNAILESSQQMRKRYSHSQMSSTISVHDQENKVNALRSLQKERLVVSRLGFVDRAMELDQEIELMLEKVKIYREKEENTLLEQRMKLLKVSHMRKQAKLEYVLGEEWKEMTNQCNRELTNMLKRQEIEFFRVLEYATRKALGKVKKCICQDYYLCRHNKRSSYNTRRPIKEVVTFRRNAKRLKQAGRPEEAIAWDEKAKELDEEEQEKWRLRIASNTTASPWGASEALVDQLTENHKKELATLQKTHSFKQETLRKQHETRRRHFKNALEGEERKMRVSVHKQCLLRTVHNVDEEFKEAQREKLLSFKSDGLKNVSKNIFGLEFDQDERKAVDWAPPTAFGLDNSVRLVDALRQVEDETGGKVNVVNDGSEVRILTKLGDMKNLTAKEMREKIHRETLGPETDDDDDDDSMSSYSTASSAGGGGNYSFGSTSGSKLMDKLRVQAHKKKILAGANEQAAAMAAEQDEIDANAAAALNNPYSNGSSSNPFALSVSNPFGGSGLDSANPFAMPQSNPFGTSSSPTNNPFALPTANPFGSSSSSSSSNANPFAMPSSNPFGSSSSTGGGDNMSTQGNYNDVSTEGFPSPVKSISTNNPFALPQSNPFGTTSTTASSSFGTTFSSSSPFAQEPSSSSSLQQQPQPIVKLNNENPMTNNFMSSSSASSSFSNNNNTMNNNNNNTATTTNTFASSSLASPFNSPIPPGKPSPSDPSFRSGKHIQSSMNNNNGVEGGLGNGEQQQPDNEAEEEVQEDEEEEAEVNATMNRGFDKLKGIEKVILHNHHHSGNTQNNNSKNSDDAISISSNNTDMSSLRNNNSSSTGVVKPKLMKYELEMSLIHPMTHPLPLDWKLEPKDSKPPSFKPTSASSKDKDWIKAETQHIREIGYGYENSYNIRIVPLTPEQQQALLQIEENKILKNQKAQYPDQFDDPNFHPDHRPPVKGSQEDSPKKSILQLQSNVGKWSSGNATKDKSKMTAGASGATGTADDNTKVKFKGSVVRIYTIAEENDGANSTNVHLPLNTTHQHAQQQSQQSPRTKKASPRGGGNNNNNNKAPIAATTVVTPTSTNNHNNTIPNDNMISATSISPSPTQNNPFQSSQPFVSNVAVVPPSSFSPSPRQLLSQSLPLPLNGNMSGGSSMSMGIAGIGGSNNNNNNAMNMTTGSMNMNGIPLPMSSNNNNSMNMNMNMSSNMSIASNSPRLSATQIQQVINGVLKNGSASPAPSPRQLMMMNGNSNNMGMMGSNNNFNNFAQSSSPLQQQQQQPVLQYNVPNFANPFSTANANSMNNNNNMGMSMNNTLTDMNTNSIANTANTNNNNHNNDDTITNSYQDARLADWNVAFYRIKHLHDYDNTLNEILLHENLFEAAEIYALSSSSSKGGNDENDDDNDGDDEDKIKVDQIGSILMFLRTWKRFVKHLEKGKVKHIDEEVEELSVGFEEVLKINISGEAETLEKSVIKALTKYKDQLDELFQKVSNQFVPEFVLSNDFLAYFEQSHQKLEHLELGCKTWLTKFGTATDNSKIGMHLFPKPSGRPLANKEMKRKFGAMCDSPSPKEYIDTTLSSPDALKTVIDAMTQGTECFVDCYVRTIEGKKPLSMLCVKPLKNKEGISLYNLVLWLDMSAEDVETELNHLNFLVRALP